MEVIEEACRQALGENGQLSVAIPGFVARPQQIELSVAIAQTILEQSILIAEAGTGTGKTFAYLVPCILSGKKIVISTATKMLQDQLVQKDLPMLLKALGRTVHVQNLKGRANYLCRHRIALHSGEGRSMSPQCVHEILHVRDKLPQLKDGDRSELPTLAEDSTVWPYVTSTADNCLGGDCEFYQTCFLVKARKRAFAADIVVINHHLYFADSRLKEQDFGELLPGVDVVVFDEAHQLETIATTFHGERVSTRQLTDLMEDILREWPIIDLSNQPLKQLKFHLDRAIEDLILSVPGQEERLRFEDVARNQLFNRAWQMLLTVLSDVLYCFTQVNVEEAGLKKCQARLGDLQNLLQSFLQIQPLQIRWIERFKHTVVFHATPVDVADFFRSLVNKKNSAMIFTSATLTIATSFACFSTALGLDTAKTLLLPSPFHFITQALLYLPRGLPDPKHVTYYTSLVAKALPIIDACSGRCFFLFTSHRALQLVASLLAKQTKYPLLIQGEEAKSILLARFRQMGNAILLGTSTFWEGVDVKGEALSCVIIDKIPFLSPVDPIIRGKAAYLHSRGISGFDGLSLPHAVIALKQGVGRLIRDVADRGILMIADPRLTGREYGQLIFSSLPPMRKTRNEHTALEFIRTFTFTVTQE